MKTLLFTIFLHLDNLRFNTIRTVYNCHMSRPSRCPHEYRGVTAAFVNTSLWIIGLSPAGNGRWPFLPREHPNCSSLPTLRVLPVPAIPDLTLWLSFCLVSIVIDIVGYYRNALGGMGWVSVTLKFWYISHGGPCSSNTQSPKNRHIMK